MNDVEILQCSLAEAADLLRTGVLTPSAYVESLAAHVTRENKTLNAFVLFEFDHALSQAEVATRDIRNGNWKGPLHGIPYGLKDIIDYAGLPTSAQSRVLRDYRAPGHAGVVSKLEDQGAIFLGKLATDEFACGGQPEDSPWPLPVNPWGHSYITAGSSSGSAVSVAAGMVPVALGTDTAGSIRNPAARCGLVGMKPTFGRVSRSGVIPLAPSMDHVGPLTRTVRDNALVMQVISGKDARDPATWAQPETDFLRFEAHMKGVRVAVARHVYTENEGSDPEQAQGIDRLVEVLRDAGALVHEVRIRALDAYNSLSRLLVSVEAYAVHENWIRCKAGEYGSRSLSRLLQGLPISAAEYQRLLQVRQRYTREINALFANADLLVTASGYDATPRIDDHEAYMKTYVRQARMLFNMTGHPALVLPTGFSQESRMPLAGQIIGRHYDEATIYRAASIFEKACPWYGEYARTITVPVI